MHMRAPAIYIFSFGFLAFGHTYAAPWSPDGSKIVYSYIGGPENLYIANGDGSEEQDLVVREQRDFRPEWSPDGSHIIFTSVVDDKHVIMTVNPDGTDLRQITQPNEAAGGADYSPDGTRLVYFTDEPLPRDIFVRELASGRDKPLTQTPDYQEMSPRWAPDSERIVFVGKAASEDAESDIWILNATNGERSNLTETPSQGEFHPDWSHDGKSIVYIRVSDGLFDVILHEVGTGVKRVIASGKGYAVLSPHFSPDDRHVSFTRTDFNEKGQGMPAIVSVSIADGSETVIAKNRYLSQMD